MARRSDRIATNASNDSKRDAEEQPDDQPEAKKGKRDSGSATKKGSTTTRAGRKDKSAASRKSATAKDSKPATATKSKPVKARRDQNHTETDTKTDNSAIKAAEHKAETGPSDGPSNGSSSTEPTTFEVLDSNGKEIHCERHAPLLSDNEETSSSRPSLIFTHGAGGGLNAPAIRHFSQGFATVAPMVSFQGSMNLKGRVRSFVTVIETCSSQSDPTASKKAGTKGGAKRGAGGGSFVALGGRSMGARAAVIACQDDSIQSTSSDHNDDDGDNGDEHTNGKDSAGPALILVSYPLTNPKGDSREDILLALPAHTHVLFISGERDSMCDLTMLARVRKEMKATSWLVVVKGADHGMGCKPKESVEPMGEKTGEIAALWLGERSIEQTEGVMEWDGEEGRVVFSGWNSSLS